MTHVTWTKSNEIQTKCAKIFCDGDGVDELIEVFDDGFEEWNDVGECYFHSLASNSTHFVYFTKLLPLSIIFINRFEPKTKCCFIYELRLLNTNITHSYPAHPHQHTKKNHYEIVSVQTKELMDFQLILHYKRNAFMRNKYTK